MKTSELSYKDLMIGDWVLYDKQPYKVSVWSILERKEIEPIPLTAEILEKNGFYYGYTSREEDAVNNTPFSLSETDKGWCWDEGSGAIKIMFPDEADGGLVEIDDQSFNRYLSFEFCDNLYVHELQHILKTCGIEKEIIL